MTLYKCIYDILDAIDENPTIEGDMYIYIQNCTFNVCIH